MNGHSNSRMWLRVFGGLRLESAEGPLGGAAAQRHRLGLLAILVASPGHQLSRDRVLALLWPERDAGQGRTLLNTAIHALRKELGPDTIRSLGDDLFLDATALESDYTRLDRHSKNGEPDLAVDEYAGPFLDGFHLPASELFDEWQGQVRERVHTHVTRLLDILVSETTNPAQQLRWTERRAHHEPHSARAALGHMRALIQAGDRSAAIEFAQRFHQRLATDLEAGPDPTVRALETELRQHADAVPIAVVPSQPTASDSAPATRATRRIRGRPRLISAGVVAATVAVVTLAVAQVRDAGSTPAPAVQTTVAVMPFEVRGQPDLDYLGAGVMDLLSARLNGMGPVSTIDPAALMQFVEAHGAGSEPVLARARRTAAAFSADRVIVGSIVALGDHRLEVRAAIHDPTGQREAEVLASGDASRLTALLDDVARRLLAEQLRGIRGAIPSLAALTTESLGALREYLEGEESMRRGEFLAAVDHFQRAVRIDTAFALGFFRLGQARERLPGLQRAWWERQVDLTAARLADRLPVFERELVATAAMPNGRALPVLRRLVSGRPSSAEAWYRLGVALNHDAAARGVGNADAVDALRRALVLDRRLPGATRALAFALARAGHFGEVMRIASDPATPASDALLARTLHAFGTGDAGGMRASLAALGTAPEPAIREAAASVTTLTRRPDRARPIYELLVASHRPVEVRWIARTRLADLAMAEGRWREARLQITLADSLVNGRHLGKRARLAILPGSPVSDAEAELVRVEQLEWFRRGRSPEGPRRTAPGLAYNAGMISASRGDTLGIREAIQALETLVGTPDETRLPMLRGSLEAEIAWIAGDPRRVIALLTDVIDPNANQRYRLASAYEAVGDVESALQWYQSYPDLDLNAPNQLGWRAASLRRMSALYEQLGDTQSARTRREEFLRLWGDADLDVQPVVDSVRSSLGSAPVRSARSSRQ